MATPRTASPVPPASVFLERTRAGDQAWAEQALALGFSPFTETSPDTPWAVQAAGEDRTGASVALCLAGTLTAWGQDPSHPHHLDALTTLGRCLKHAIDHRNVPFLDGMAPLYDRLPERAKSALRNGLMWTTPTAPAYPHLLWTLVVHGAMRSDLLDRDRQAWAWVRGLKGYAPALWADASPEGLRTVLIRQMQPSTFNLRSAHRAVAFMEALGLEPMLGPSPDMIDAAMAPWRRHAPLDRWTVNNDDATTRRAQLQGLLEVIAWAARRAAPTVNEAGQALLHEAQGWADELGRRRDGLERFAHPLRALTVQWETAVLQRTLADGPRPDGEERPTRPRL